MAHVGRKQAVNAAAGSTIATAALTNIGWIRECAGAEGVLVRFRNGSDTTHALFVVGATGFARAQAGAPASAETGLNANLVSDGLPKTNGDKDSANWVWIHFVDSLNNARPIPFGALYLQAQMATADSTTVIVEAWVVGGNLNGYIDDLDTR